MSRHMPQRRVQDDMVSDSTSPVDALFDRAMRQWQMALPNQVLPAVPAQAGLRGSASVPDSVQLRAESSTASALVEPLPATALSREEVVHIADRVTQVLKQRERFERERQGRR